MVLGNFQTVLWSSHLSSHLHETEKIEMDWVIGCLGCQSLLDSSSVYTDPSPTEREEEKR